jgi:uncharacterized protein (TIGR01244 family)
MFRTVLSFVLLSVLCLGLSTMPAVSQQAAQEDVQQPAQEAVQQEVQEAPQEPVPSIEIPIRNARTPLEGVLTGGQVTEADLTAAAQAGYRTVVNLRTLGEEGAWDETEFVEGLGMRFLHIPVAGAAGLTEDNVQALAEVIEDEANHPLLIHCGSGNRVGALFALKAFQLDGKSAEEALAIGLEAGLTRLEPAVRERLEGADP